MLSLDRKALSASLLVAFVLLHINACSSIKVKVTESNDEIIVRGSSYGWEFSALRNHKGINQRALLVDDQVRRELAHAMQSKGLKAVDDQAAPRWLIAYRMLRSIQYDQGGIISPRDETERMLRQGMDDPNTETAFYNHPVPNQLENAELIITLISADDRQTFWEVSVSKLLEVDTASDKALEQAIASMVERAFRQFPVVK